MSVALWIWEKPRQGPESSLLEMLATWQSQRKWDPQASSWELSSTNCVPKSMQAFFPESSLALTLWILVQEKQFLELQVFRLWKIEGCCFCPPHTHPQAGHLSYSNRKLISLVFGVFLQPHPHPHQVHCVIDGIMRKGSGGFIYFYFN